MERFFVTTPPGFENETEAELREVWPELLSPAAAPHDLPLPAFERKIGGLEFETEPFAAVQLNFFLKTASRILWRLDEFRVRDFPKLHSRLKKIDVAARLGTKDFSVRAAAGTSRLGHEGRLEETARQAWGVKAASKDENPAILLRLENDVCTVSLDTTGEHLHRRGINLHRGEAPVRETIAAFCLRKMMTGLSAGELRTVSLVDPMCGSGTFLTEAASLWGGHFQRDYRFQTFRGLPKLFQQPRFDRNYKTLPAPPFGRLRGFDRDEKVVRAARANAARAQEFFPGANIEIGVRDLFEGDREEAGGWLVANPPYGERLQTDLPGEEPQKILERMLDIWRPRRIGVLWTEPIGKKLKWPGSSRLISETKLKNGGIDSLFTVREIGEAPALPRDR